MRKFEWSIVPKGAFLVDGSPSVADVLLVHDEKGRAVGTVMRGTGNPDDRWYLAFAVPDHKRLFYLERPATFTVVEAKGAWEAEYANATAR